jgi:hypothetical protein
MQKADTEYLAREIASLRIALGEVATRDFLRSELNRLGDDIAGALPPARPERTPRHELERDRERTRTRKKATRS